MRLKKLFFSLILLFIVYSASYAQEIRCSSLRLPENILGYKPLKCDFHLHTIFSDGLVWPSVRVDEALAEGLDAIAITDHLEYRPHMKNMGTDNLSHSFGYEFAKKAADAAGIILIPGIEITKEAPPGHFNAIFIKDANKFNNCYNKENPRDGRFIRKALTEARDQGAFIFWNHPWFQIPMNKSIWFPIIDSLYNEGYIDGVEVVNATKYDPVILSWVQSKSLTNIANTDLHTPSGYNNGRYRTMTIVFAKEKSAESIREALEERRTVSYCNEMLIGDKVFLEEIFKKSIQVSFQSFIDKNGMLVLKNSSSLKFDVKIEKCENAKLSTYTGGLTIPANGETAVKVTFNDNYDKNKGLKVEISVLNLEVEPNTPLKTTINIL